MRLPWDLADPDEDTVVEVRVPSPHVMCASDSNAVVRPPEDIVTVLLLAHLPESVA